MHSPLRFAAAALLAAVLLAQSQTNVEGRVEALLARMTLDEKIGQMSQSTAMATPISDGIKAEIRAGRWGSFLNAGSPADRAEAQRIATMESRLHIPLLFGRDVIHGYKTIFPIPLAQAATWDPELVEQASRQAAREAAAEGIRWTFAPMIDIARDPRWGRVAESLGEDPRLGSTLAAAMVRGFQGAALADAASLAACAKHFVGYGAAEAGRDYNSAWIPEILLREVYLPPFHAARDAGVATFMTAFNTLNAVPATGNRFLLRDILRTEWKYDGVVVSDYEAVTEMIRHGYARDAREAARKAANAGVDMEMVSTAYYANLKSLVEGGEVNIAEIDGAVRNILRLKFRLGLFDQPIPAPTSVAPTASSLELAQRAATESAVLLKNDRGLLPLSDSTRTVAIVGPLADSPVDQMGTWSMDGRPEDVQTPLAAFRKLLGSERVHYAPGLRNSRDLGRDGFAAAVAATRGADVGGALPRRGTDSFRRSAFPSVPESPRRAGSAGRCRRRDRQAAGAGDHGRPSPHVSRCGREGRRGAVCVASRLDGWTGHRESAAGAHCSFGAPPDHVSPHRGTGSHLLRAPEYGAAGVGERAGHSDGQSRTAGGLHIQVHRCGFYAGISVRLRSDLQYAGLL